MASRVLNGFRRQMRSPAGASGAAPGEGGGWPTFSTMSPTSNTTAAPGPGAAAGRPQGASGESGPAATEESIGADSRPSVYGTVVRLPTLDAPVRVPAGPTSEGPPAPRPIRYPVLNRCSDWWAGTRDGRAGFPTLEGADGADLVTAHVRLIVGEFREACGTERTQMVRDTCHLRERALAARHAVDGFTARIADARAALANVELECANPPPPQRLAGEQRATPEVIAMRRGRDREARREARMVAVRAAEDGLAQMRAEILICEGGIIDREHLLRTQIDRLHSYARRRLARYGARLVRTHLHGHGLGEIGTGLLDRDHATELLAGRSPDSEARLVDAAPAEPARVESTIDPFLRAHRETT